MDSIDKKILLHLQGSARKRNVELARELNIAPSTVMERIRRMEESGLIQGYRGIINPEMIGLSIQAFIAVSLIRHDVNIIKKFEESIQEISHVCACYHLAGRFDYLLHVVAQNQKQMGEIVKKWIASIPGIGKVETFLLLSEVKPDSGWPIEQDMFSYSGEEKNSNKNINLKRGVYAKKNDS